jgi:hypothetical protein
MSEAPELNRGQPGLVWVYAMPHREGGEALPSPPLMVSPSHHAEYQDSPYRQASRAQHHVPQGQGHVTTDPGPLDSGKVHCPHRRSH